MVFDSGVFLVFFALFFVLYHAARRSLLVQNVLLLAGSYVFYGWWDWRFLALMTISSGVDYAAGLALDRVRGLTARRAILWASLATNLGFLFTFKYFDFFADSLGLLLARLGIAASFPLLHLVLPIGISFYTFQSMSYTIDVYRGHLKPERDPIKYFAFVSFFPHLVAGPIHLAGPTFCFCLLPLPCPFCVFCVFSGWCYARTFACAASPASSRGTRRPMGRSCVG